MDANTDFVFRLSKRWMSATCDLECFLSAVARVALGLREKVRCKHDCKREDI